MLVIFLPLIILLGCCYAIFKLGMGKYLIPIAAVFVLIVCFILALTYA